MTILAVPPTVLYHVPKRLFLIHLFTSPPMLANQQQKISADSRAVISVTRIHRLLWFGWNLVRLVDTRW